MVLGTCEQHAGAAGWRVAGASVQGVGHERAGLPCQDAHRWAVNANGVWLAAVADGAGSAPLAEVGATLAVGTALAAMQKALALRVPDSETDWRELLTGAIAAARTGLEAESETRGVALRDLATTLVLVAATGDTAAALQIGDGAVILGDRNGDLTALTTPGTAEYANETTFLTAPDAIASAQFALRQGGITHIAILTDGLQRLALKMPDGEPHPPFFAPLLRFADGISDLASAASQLTAFLRSPRITERADDDLTLLLASRF